MDDSQSPPDDESRAGNGQAGSARRPNLRLRDAEAVATTRRDIFGDGSLLDSLAGRPARNERQLPQAASAEGDAAAATDASDHDPFGGVAAEPAQSLDAFIDSVSADPSLLGEEQPLGPRSDVSFPATAGSEFHVSAIFEGLRASDPRSEGDTDTAPLLETGAASGAEATAAAAAAAEEAAPPAEPAAGSLRLGVPLFYQPTAMPPMPEPSDWPAPAGDANGWDMDASPQPSAESAEASGFNPGLDNEWPALLPSANEAPGGGAYQVAEEPGPKQPADRVDLPDPMAWPPFMEPPTVPPADADVAPLKPPSLVSGAGPETEAAGSPFPAPPQWPPYLEPPGGDTDPTTATPSGLPPYIELPAHPGKQGEPAALAQGAYHEPPSPGSYPEAYPGGSGSMGAGMASAKIAAEANATAQALDNLQRLLSKTVAAAAPPSQPFRPQPPSPRQHNQHFHLPQDEPFAHEMAPMLPLPVAPPDTSDGKRVYLLGFLTGLVLSVMAGAALYFLITAT